MKIIIGADHAGFLLKETIKKHLQANGIEVKDAGCYSEDRVDYPDFAHAVAHAVEKKEYPFGILICGSANGISMAANKHKGIRAAVCWNMDVAMLARQHNDANIISLPARFISEDEAKKMVIAFLNEKFEGGRHAGRVEKITAGC
jgi:ribose 5-phosphate isomerase B